VGCLDEAAIQSAEGTTAAMAAIGVDSSPTEALVTNLDLD
jgi:hypothetical protein